MTDQLPERRQLPHGVPNWVPDGETYFITINCRNRGSHQLTKPDNFAAIQESAQHYTLRERWHIRLMVVMPDHLHALVTFDTRNKTISTIIGGWKRYLAKNTDIEWQMNYFEHRIRNSDELVEKEAYMRNNPVRAGLTKRADNWSFIISDYSD